MASPNARPDAEHPDDEPDDTGAPETAGDDAAAHDLDVDTQWAGIVAELGDLDTRAATPAEADHYPSKPPFPVAPWVRSAGPRDWPATPEVEALEDADTHFTPPDPPFVLGRDPLLTMAWGLVAGVPMALLILVVVLHPVPAIVAQIGFGAFLAGLAVLVWRMPHRRDRDDDDPGAVV